jgi:putative hydrolase of the HAD superfamily
MSVEAVFFDIGGVVAKCDLEQYAPMAAKLFESTEEAIRVEVQSRVVSLETGKTDANTFWEDVGLSLQSKGLGKLPPEHRYQHLWLKALKHHLKLDINLLNVCWSLQRKGLIVGALSNTIEEHAEHLAQIGTYQPFKPCILSYLVGLRKPDAAIYKMAAKKAAKALKKCLLVDDVEENVEGARQAGMQGFLYRDLPGLLIELNRLKIL